MKNENKIDIENEIKKYDIELDEDGRYIINSTIYDDSHFLSPYSSCNKEIISDEIAQFLEQSSKIAPPKANLHLKVYSDQIDDTEKDVYKKAIKRYYLNQIIDIKRRLLFNSIVSLIFTLIGLATFIFLLFFSNIFSSDIIYEIISIFGWVFLWEAVDNFFIERANLNRHKHRYINLYSAKITYYNLEK